MVPRRLVCIGNRSYIVGKHYLSAPTAEQSSALDCSGNMEVFSRLLKNNILYHSTNYGQFSSGKRNDSYCCYRDKDGVLHYAIIELFVKSPRPCVFVR